jgi:hypothetical protein
MRGVECSGACWLALTLWQCVALDVLWAEATTAVAQVFVPAAYRLIAPGTHIL